ncbi:inositol-1,4,5-trisphosphate (IP3) 5-phosphatase [Trypanosoma grayi]|uniref:inositol-1,4,5-trisphosphate (IP3) 5-phosphatase n=1 Tax=Trypanosoma grayi TaxID=71804 RepID=UPI0004F440DB|nr:inositol-1,4,5-trisphosphate (IP3) 5-phosphatase [Trypanosoma grayi]KEG10491.1 inositol-1,4,5-trisphosphate (IP3) 5-phosphatase [Trypanosoma grayi]
MRSLLDGITSALRIPQQYQQQWERQAATDFKTSGSAATKTDTTTDLTIHDQASLPLDTLSHATRSELRRGGNSSCSYATETPSDLPFSMLLLTQNVGGIDPSSTDVKGSDESAGEGAKGVRDSVQRFVVEFVGELRVLIHEASRREFAAYLRKGPSDPESCLSPVADDTAANVVAPPLLDVIVVHFQEIGGKRMDVEFNAVFAEALKELLPEAGWSSGLLMEANNDAGRFTAMGTIVFLSHRMCPISSILSFRHRTFVSVMDDPATYTGSPASLFHGGKFSTAGASRKGFLLTSLRFGTVVVNYLNVHLYHDTRNTEASRTSPSPYTLKRQEALLEAMAECLVVISPQDPLFVFGDFNVRLDACALLQHLKETNQMDVKLDEKGVHAPDSFWELFSEPSHAEIIKKFDVELQRLMDVVAQQSGVELAEFAVRFPPTYAHTSVEDCPQSSHTTGMIASDDRDNAEEGEETMETKKKVVRTEATGDKVTAQIVLTRIMATPARDYVRKRIAAWCDRIVWNPAGLELMTGRRSASTPSPVSVKSGGGDGSLRRYAYRSFALSHTDHDAVALLF